MQLSIKVRGELVSTNFEVWKQDLINQIRAVKTDLATDADFALAELSVKKFKTAEKSLKAAKSSAIGQAPDIFKLFEAIDEVSEEVRSVRLTLERQVRQRKQEIKSELIDASVERVRAYIDRHAVLNGIDMSDYVDGQAFLEAGKRRTTVKTLVAALDALSSSIERQIDDRAVLVQQNMRALDGLTAEQQLIFQDRAHLLRLTKRELGAVIDERISRWRERESSGPEESLEQVTEGIGLSGSTTGAFVPREQQDGRFDGAGPSSRDLGEDAIDALPILEALVNGCDPLSGRVLLSDSLVMHPRVQSALVIAIRALKYGLLKPLTDASGENIAQN